MPSNTDLIQALLTAVTQGDTQTLESVFADHVILHVPGRNRFAGDYFGKATVMQFWSMHHETLTPITLHDVRTMPDQVIADVSLYTQRTKAGDVLVCEGTCVFHIVQEQIMEWWLQIAQQTEFDAFWSSAAAATARRDKYDMRASVRKGRQVCIS